MSARHVVIVGAGVAGTAAAWSASGGDCKVTVVHDRAGSSALYSGALDGPRAPEDAEAAVGAFVQALGVWDLGRRVIPTREGVIREVFGADRALLDLAPLAGKHVALADVARDDWDAPLLARAFAADDFSRRTGTRFSLVPVAALRRGHERRLTSHDFAALHDDPERLSALARLLVDAGAGFDAWLVGPWLGTRASSCEPLLRSVAVPVGETTSGVGGAAGARFEAARDALLAARSIARVRGRVAAVEARGTAFTLRLHPDDAGDLPMLPATELEATAVVLATGGVAAGGIELARDPLRGAQGFRLPFDAPAELSLDGEPSDAGGSLYGPSLEVRGLGVLERVGIAALDDGNATRDGARVAGLFVAGDALAARPRSVLEAVRSGVAAGAGALGHASR